jgi:hypothetical protein
MTSTQGTSKEEQDMNMQFTHAVEMTKNDVCGNDKRKSR